MAKKTKPKNSAVSWYVTYGTGPGTTTVKGPLSKKQALDFCKTENEKCYAAQVEIRKSQPGVTKVRRDHNLLYRPIKKEN